MSTIDFDSFLVFCDDFKGKSMLTKGGRAIFKLSAVKADSRYMTLSYVPKSSGRERYATRKYLEKVLERYALTGSLRPTDYKGITANAPYTLKLIELYLQKH